MRTFGKWMMLGTTALALQLGTLSEADASSARRNGLAGSRLIQDRDDVFAFPQLSVDWANLVGFDYGQAASQGTGVLIMGDQSRAFGVALHRGALMRSTFFPYANDNAALGSADSPFASELTTMANATPGTIVDVFGGMGLNPGLVGARLVLGNGGASITPASSNQDDQSGGEFYSLLQLGYSMTGRLALDTALNIGFSTMSFDVGKETPLSGTYFGLGLDARGSYTLRPFFDLGFLGGIRFSNQGTDTKVGTNTVSTSTTSFGIQAGAGPVWRIKPRRALAAEDAATPAAPAAPEATAAPGTTIAAYGILGYQMRSNDPNTDNDNDASGNSMIILPGLHLAADIELLDWLYFRSGAQYLWAIQGTSAETSNGDNKTSSRQSAGGALGNGFAWSTGLGVRAGDFRFDGTFSNNFLLNGPAFIGGGAGFLTSATVEYSWR